MEKDGWYDTTIAGKRTFVANTPPEFARYFFDHALIASLGCGACINVPVCAMGEVVGTLNVLDAEHAYDARHLALVEAAAPALVAPFLAVTGRLAR